jgi:ABC-type Na+ efflux pump permease subunit
VFIFLAMVFQDVVFVEKMKKGYENLLATPISVQDLVLGKTLFIFLFAYLLALGLALVLLGILSVYGIAYPLLYSLANILVIFPVTVFAIAMILTSVVLQYKAGQQIMQMLLFFVMIVASGFFYASPYILRLVEGLSYQAVFAVSILSGAVIFSAVAVLIFKKVDGEKIVLTG